MYVRPITYSLVICCLLGYLSLELYHLPGQVRARVESDLMRFLERSPRLDDCRARLLPPRDLTLGQLAVAAAPVLEKRRLLLLEGIRLRDLPAGELDSEVVRPPGGLPRAVRVRRAELFLERRRADDLTAIDAAWNFEGALRWNEFFALTGSFPHVVSVHELVFGYTELDVARSRQAWRMAGADVTVRGAPGGGLAVRLGRVTGEYWKEAKGELVFRPPSRFEVTARIEDCVDVAPWLPFLGDGHRRLLARWQPQGRFSCDIERCVLDGDGLRELRADIRYYDGSFALPSAGLVLRHVQGLVRLDEKGALVGGEGVGGPLVASLWGADVELEGHYRDGREELHLRLPRQALAPQQGGASFGQRPGLAAVLEILAPEGSLEGELRLGPGDERSAALRGELRVVGARLRRLPWWSDIHAAVATGGGTTGEGEVRVSRSFLHGVGEIQGAVGYRWRDGELALDLDGLEAVGDAPRGAISGELRVRPDGGFPLRELTQAPVELSDPAVPWRGEVKWENLAFGVSLLRADTFSGMFAGARDGRPAAGKFELLEVNVPAGLAGERLEPLSFARGDGIFSVEGGRFHLRSLTLRGPEGLLRATGWVDFSGGVDLVSILAGPSHAELADSSLDSAALHEWRGVAGDDLEAYRVTGTLAEPRARQIGPFDPIFVEPK